MPILVQKYGGSSVADLDKIKRVAQKIVAARERGYDLVVVVSAMGDTTDELLDMARRLCAAPSVRELDMLLSVGERISMALLSMAIHELGHQAISLTGSQCGIITTASHSNARIMDVRPFRVQDELERGSIVIVAGYQGTSYKREVTTLGRGGSDTTAVALAAALQAEACEIYSDVDGVYSADPRVVLDAQQLLSLSYDEMLEMARSGARVLNEQAVEFARRAQIALYARSTHLPQSEGTVIRADGFEELTQRHERGLPAVAVSHVQEGLWLSQVPLEALDDAGLGLGALEMVSFQVSGQHLEAYLSLENLGSPERLEAALQALGAKAQRQGFVSLIGYGIGGRPQWWLQAQALLKANGLNPVASFQSVARLSWVLPQEQVAQAAQLLHTSFCL